jgi:hypothetical protein
MILRQYIRMLIKEAAVQPKQAASDGLALFVAGSHYEIELVLYDPIAVYNSIVEFINDRFYDPQTDTYDKDNFDIDIVDVDMHKTLKAYGAIIISSTSGKCNKAWSVTQSEAQHGYGPFVYDIAMQLAPAKTIMPDRVSVSDEAQKIWMHYLNQRDDVIKEPLPDNCVLGQGWEGENYSYRATKKIPLKTFISNHRSFVKDVISLSKLGPRTLDKGSVEKMIYFLAKYSVV